MTIIDYLIRSAERVPEKTAFEDASGSITFRELYETASVLCTQLFLRLGTVKSPVAVLIDRNLQSICAFLGVAMSRNFYVPVDVSLPEKRVLTIMEQMQPEAILSIGNIPDSLKENTDIPVFEYEELLQGSADPDCISRLLAEAIDTDPLYAICTSGSTGVPKGVLISHRSVLDFIPVFCETFAFTEDDRFGNQAPFDFDVSVKDIYSTLYLGATMYIIPKICFIMPKMLMDALNEKQITVIVWAVSALCIIAELNMFDYAVPVYLKKVLFSGEVMPIKMLNVWMEHLPDAMYVNLYGPTEITCNCLYYILDRKFDVYEKLPLGVPFKNETVLYLDSENRPVKCGSEGEICVLGTCLALGYYNNPEKTAQSFVQNPLNDRYPELMYRTGDIAELREDGNYYFAARKDFQIKHMGHRIELEEIEAHINAIDGVTRTSCLYDEGNSKLVAYYTGTPDFKTIIKELKLIIPRYMIPNAFIQKTALPLNKNGKIDRQLLKKEYFESL